MGRRTKVAQRATYRPTCHVERTVTVYELIDNVATNNYVTGSILLTKGEMAR